MSASVEIRAPEEQTEGTRSQLLRWLRAVGESVRAHEPLIELETDKVTVEIAAPTSGVLMEILKREQEEIAPGELLGRIDPASGAAAPDAAPAPADTRAAAAAVGPADGGAADERAHLSPAVKRLLAEHAIAAAAVSGTGRGGRVTLEDVRRHLVARPAHGQHDELPAPARRIPHTAMRRRIAARMVESLLQTAPHVTAVFEADLSAVLAHRERHREEFARRGASLTLTAYFLAACVEAIHAVPEVNARWTEDALQIFDTMDIGVGTALGAEGLVVPVVRGVERRDLFGIARELGELVARARAGSLRPADVRGGTFTVSNHGVSGSLLAAPIVINQPQSAILGVGRLEKRAVVLGSGDDERIVARPRCYVTLTIDHRVMDGFRGNRFLQVLVERLEHWS